MHKHHILSFSFHMCVTRQWEFIIKVPIPQEVIYNYKNTRVQEVHILPLASISDATAFHPNRIMSVSWNALCGIWHILFCSNNEVSLFRKYSEKIIKEYMYNRRTFSKPSHSCYQLWNKILIMFESILFYIISPHSFLHSFFFFFPCLK